jgi:hypothetical protein
MAVGRECDTVYAGYESLKGSSQPVMGLCLISMQRETVFLDLNGLFRRLGQCFSIVGSRFGGHDSRICPFLISHHLPVVVVPNDWPEELADAVDAEAHKTD